jgi:hypothetical protein
MAACKALALVALAAANGYGIAVSSHVEQIDAIVTN